MKRPAELDLIRESIITFLWDSLDKIVAFIAFVYFANYFTTTSFGSAYTVIGISVMASSVPNSIAIAIQKRVSEDTSDQERFFSLGSIIILGYTLLAGGITIGLISATETQFEYLALAGLTHLTGRPFLFHVERLFDGVGSPGTAAGLDFVDGILTSLLRFLFILGLGMGSEGLLYSAAVSGIIVGLVAYFWEFGLPTQRPTLSAFYDVKQFSGWMLIARVGNEMFENAAVVLAGTLISPSFASYIKSAKNLVEPARIPVRSVIKPIFVQISTATESGDELLQPFQNGIDVATVFAIPLAVGALVLGDEIMVTIYGGGYAGSGYVLFAVSSAFIFGSLSKICTSVLSGSNNPHLVAFAGILTPVVSIPIFILAATLSGESIFLTTLILFYSFRLSLLLKYINKNIVDLSSVSWRFIADQLVSSTCMGGILFITLRYVMVDSWIILITIVSIGALFYSLVLFGISAQGRRIAQTISNKLASSEG